MVILILVVHLQAVIIGELTITIAIVIIIIVFIVVIAIAVGVSQATEGLKAPAVAAATALFFARAWS